jgi:hypothetical protein
MVIKTGLSVGRNDLYRVAHEFLNHAFSDPTAGL